MSNTLKPDIDTSFFTILSSPSNGGLHTSTPPPPYTPIQIEIQLPKAISSNYVIKSEYIIQKRFQEAIIVSINLVIQFGTYLNTSLGIAFSILYLYLAATSLDACRDS